MKCVYCENEFESPYPDKLYCGKTCRNRAHESRAGEYGGSRWRSRRKRQAVKADFVYEDKVAKGCSRCPERRPNCLQYHHVDPTTKRTTVSNLTKKDGYSLEAVKEEIAKCILLCANCHAVEETGDGYRAF